MYKMKNEMQEDIRHNVRGGVGSPVFHHIFTAEELGGRGEMLAVVSLKPGESIGVHPHRSNGEAYYILSGSATVSDDAETRILHKGDGQFCADGHTHSILNHTDSEIEFLAVIFPDR